MEMLNVIVVIDNLITGMGGDGVIIANIRMRENVDVRGFIRM